METTRKLIRQQSLEKLYNNLAGTNLIYAPVNSEGNKVEFRYNPMFSEVTFEHIRSTLSPKNIVFPKIESLITFSNTKTESSVNAIDPGKIREVVLWGSHPCDNGAIKALESIFCQAPGDILFSGRRDKLLVVGLSCHRSDEYCFCTSTGVSPSAGVGSDLLLTKLQGGDYMVEIFTGKGSLIVSAYPDLFEDFNGETVVVTEIRQKFSHEKVTEKLNGMFESTFWEINSLRCIGCGACAYVCPACACFDIQDESWGKKGNRYRCWDSCGFGLFTLHTSGHNPRHLQSQRWRQRIMHKFSYMPQNNNSIGCVGCGRCSSSCPVDMNIAAQMEAIQNN